MISNAYEDCFDIAKRCPICLKGVATSLESETFRYGIDGPARVTLTVIVPVRYCHGCGFSYTDYVAEDIRSAAVKDYLAFTPFAAWGIARGCTHPCAN